MTVQLAAQTRRPVFNWLGVQLGVSLALSFILGAIFGLEIMRSLICAALSAIVPNLVFAWDVFAASGAQQKRRIVLGLYRGEVLKIVLLMLLVSVSIKWLAVNKVWYFGALVVAYCSTWFAPWFIDGGSR